MPCEINCTSPTQYWCNIECDPNMPVVSIPMRFSMFCKLWIQHCGRYPAHYTFKFMSLPNKDVSTTKGVTTRQCVICIRYKTNIWECYYYYYYYRAPRCPLVVSKLLILTHRRYTVTSAYHCLWPMFGGPELGLGLATQDYGTCAQCLPHLGQTGTLQPAIYTWMAYTYS